MIRNIYVRKILEYDPTFNNSFTRFAGYSKITSQKLNPGIYKNSSTYIDTTLPVDVIYHSKLLRAYESARTLSSELKKYPTENLNEIQFQLENLVSQNEFNKMGSQLVRERFIQHYVHDKLIENQQEIISRVENILDIIRKTKAKNILLISHSFFMKIMEAFIWTDGQVVYKPELIRNYIKPEYKTYNFGRGFKFKLTTFGNIILEP